jgi:hypothetical protein
MKKLTPTGIIRLLHEEYQQQLVAKLQEVALFDSRGTLVIDKDLKVIHKPSGYVYTVKGVTGDPGSAKVVLRAPEEPRIESQKPSHLPPKESEMLEDSDPEKDQEKEDKKDWGIKAYPKEVAPPKSDKGETMFVIDQKEFEKYYKEA